MRLNINGIDLYYMDIGPKDSDETVVLLHGWGANSSLYRSITDLLSEKRRVIAPDFPGFGETAEPDRPWEVKDFADCAVELIRSLGLKKVVLYGHSHGGRVSLDIAARADIPFELTRMVLMDAAGIVPKKTLKQKIRQKNYKIARTVLAWKWVKALYPDALENLRRSHGSADYLNASPMMRQTLVKVVNTSMEWAMPKVKVPTLLLWGEKDTATPITDGERMEALIPQASLVRIPDAGHFCYVDRWPLVAPVLEAFFDPREVK